MKGNKEKEYCEVCGLPSDSKKTTDKPECIYIATRLTAPYPIEYLYNLKQSLKAANGVWRRGHYPYVPGLDFMLYLELDGNYGYGEKLPYNLGLEYLRRCDSILIYNGLKDANGVKVEYKEAKKYKLKIYKSIEEIPIVIKSK